MHEGGWNGFERKNIGVVVSMSTAQVTFQKAASLLSLAKNSAADASTLAACVTIILAASLEQGLMSVMTYAAEWAAIDQGIEFADSKVGALCKASLRKRVMLAPMF